ncbi:hypothetical protein ANN_08636 [Periplaneta americana]|uniref:Uncharacterized protein n=1 Tax=Periplaneta americana TaxID=6978 RepID=A0ABQ8T3L1_PERAM|nr:hypothetical protein ANN_08636 [Periplaneta americana]
MAGLCEGGNEPLSSLKAINSRTVDTVICLFYDALSTAKTCGYLASEGDEGDNASATSPGSSAESYPAFALNEMRENPGKTLNQHRKLPSICSYWVEGKPLKNLKKPQPGNLPQPGIEPGPPGFAARRSDRYSTGVDMPILQLKHCEIAVQGVLQLRSSYGRAAPG